jgi:hypothetical protein
MSPAGTRRGILTTVLAAVTLAVAGCGSSHPRTEVLRSANRVTAGIYIRITGPGGAVNYIAQRFISGDAFDRFNFHKTHREDVFLPPGVQERKLCGSTHVIQPVDAPQLQKWRGRRLAITIYGSKTSAIYCAVLGYGLYLGPS